MQIQRYAPGSYGGMCQSDTGKYLYISDVEELLEAELGHDRAQAVIREHFEVPETCDDR